MNTFLNLVCLIFDPITIVFMSYILFSQRGGLFAPKGYRLGLAVSIAGLIGQVIWSYEAVAYGTAEAMSHMPWWVGKDLGYFIFGATYLIGHIHDDGDDDKIRAAGEKGE